MSNRSSQRITSRYAFANIIYPIVYPPIVHRGFRMKSCTLLRIIRPLDCNQIRYSKRHRGEDVAFDICKVAKFSRFAQVPDNEIRFTDGHGEIRRSAFRQLTNWTIFRRPFSIWRYYPCTNIIRTTKRINERTDGKTVCTRLMTLRPRRRRWRWRKRTR